MQWGQIKVLFILSFLILDIFLLQQFLAKQQQTELGQISTAESEDIETELENKGITIADDALPSETPAVESIKSSGSEFSEEIRSQIESLEEEGKQEIEFVDNTVKATLKEPVKVTEDNIINQVNQVVPFSNQYSYWGWDEEQGVALFFQKYSDQTIYFNKGGYLMVIVEDGKITQYAATLLTFSNLENDAIESTQQNDELISSLTAIKILSDAGKLSSGDEVTSVKIGYHSRFTTAPGEENGPQVFAPTWKITVDEDQNYFVSALLSEVIEIPEEEFINTTLNSLGLNEQTTDSQTEQRTNNSSKSSAESN